MAADQILIICDGEFSFGSMLASYIRFYSIDQFQPVVITLHQQHLHPLAVQVMSEDGIDISECKPLNINKIKITPFGLQCTSPRKCNPVFQNTSTQKK